jgi:hypothetical protein
MRRAAFRAPVQYTACLAWRLVRGEACQKKKGDPWVALSCSRDAEDQPPIVTVCSAELLLPLASVAVST